MRDLLDYLILGVLIVAGGQANSECKIFDATRFTNKPVGTGMHSISLWQNNWGDPVPVNAEGRWVINKESSGEFMDTVAQVHKFGYDYTLVLNEFREANPDASAGFYGVLPARRYRSLPDWEIINDLMRPIAARVDYIYPSLYTFHNAPDIWEDNALDVIAEAKRYGKKVYPFLWFRYHNTNPTLGNSEIDRVFWRRQLDLVCANADGVVIWDGSKGGWNENAPWWQETKDLMGDF